ncbi:MAG: right-handed parallel beta-helix repeat-containing protein [Chloroflexota bacterium]|nr:right-handed parallel beta-helix repeat-containing protein [Chloroflexota bacterium]
MSKDVIVRFVLALGLAAAGLAAMLGLLGDAQVQVHAAPSHTPVLLPPILPHSHHPILPHSHVPRSSLASIGQTVVTVCPAGSPACDYDSIQDAVNAAPSGALIKVAQGTYTDTNTDGRVVYINKTLTLQGGYTTADWDNPDPATNQTILNGEGVAQGVYINTGSAPTVEGFRIYNGNTSSDGGGVYVAECNAVIRNNWIYSNTSTGSNGGGGLYLAGGNPTVEENRIYENVVDWDLRLGGGIYVQLGNPTIRRNEIYTNTARSGGGIYVTGGGEAKIWDQNQIYDNAAKERGGGVYIVSANPTVADNYIYENRVDGTSSDHGGGGVYIYSANTPVVQGNAIYSNSVAGGGGGINVFVGSNYQPVIEQNAVYGNSANWGGGFYFRTENGAADVWNNLIYGNTASAEGGGIYVFNGEDDCVIQNNTIDDNQAVSNGGGGIYRYGGSPTIRNNIVVNNVNYGIYGRTGPGAITATYCDVWNNSGGQYGGSVSPGTGNQTVDPQFEDPGVDFHLGTGSPCIGAADPTAGHYPDFDYANYARPFGTRADIGAYERYEGACFTQIDGITPTRVYSAVQTAVDAAAAGSLVKVSGLCTDTGSYVADLTQALTLRGGYALTNWNNPITRTILDGQGQRRVIRIANTSAVTVDGFIVRGGDAGGGDGGGLYIATAHSPLVQNVIFYSNTAQNGGGLASVGGNPLLFNDTFVINVAANNGGGLYIGAGAPVISNTIVASNVASSGSGVWAALAASPDLDYNDYWNNDCVNCDGTGAHSISDNPLFVDFAGYDFRLRAESTCIHAGDRGPDTDFEGDVRPLGPGRDIGADEAATYPDVDLGPTTLPELRCLPTESVTHTHYLTNTGGIADTYDLTHTADPPSWTVHYAPSFTLAAGQAMEVPVVVTVPVNAPYNSLGIVTLTAESRLNQFVYDVVRNTTRVSQSVGASLTPDYTKNVDPGTVVTYEHTLRNTGNAANTFEIVVSPGPAWATTSVTPTNVSLGVYEAATVLVRVEVLDTTPGGLVEETTVTASSTLPDNDAQAVAIDRTEVNHAPGGRYVAQTGIVSPTDTLNNCQVKAKPCRTIAYAVGQAVSGDTITVATGIYYEYDIMLNKNITLTGGYDDSFSIWNPDIYPAVVDAQGLGRVFEIFGSPILDGFTVRGGSTPGSGGGVYVGLGAPVIRRNVITGNVADASGGGVFNERGDLTLEQNELAYNSAYRGGGFASRSDAPNFWNNFVYENTAVAQGGGVYVSGGSPRIWHDTFYGNTAEEGGGLYLGGDSPVVSNTIFVNNDATVAGGGVYSQTTGATLDYNDYWGNTAAGVANDYFGMSAGPNSVFYDPLFVDAAARNLHLRVDSPCQSIGDDTPLVDDFDGDPRPMPLDSAPDIGADEYRLVGIEFVADSEKIGYRQETVIHTHYLTNTGSYTDTFAFACASSQGWAVCPDPVVVGVDRMVSVEVKVPIPNTAISGEVDYALVTAASIADPSPQLQRHVNDTTIVGRSYGVDVLPDESRIWYVEDPSQPVLLSYSRQIMNTGSWEDTFDLIPTNIQPWNVTITPNPVTLGADESTWMTAVDITVSGPAPGSGICDVDPPVVDVITLTAVSRGNPSATSSEVDVIVIDPCPGVSLTPDHPDGLEYPGQTAHYTHTLRNTGHYWDTYLFAWPAEVDIYASPSAENVPPDGTSAIYVDVKIPDDPPPPCGTQHTVVITAYSGISLWPDFDVQLESVVDITTIAAFPVVQLEYTQTARLASDPIQDTLVTYTHLLTNSGNCDFTFNLGASSSLGFDVIVTPTQTSLAAGVSVPVLVTVTVPPTDVLCSNAMVDTTVIDVSTDGFSFPSSIDTVTDTTYVNLCEVTLYPPYTTTNTGPGAIITHAHILSNSGVITDSYVLDFTNQHGWDVVITPTSFSDRPPGTGVTVTAQIHVPPTVTEALSGTVDQLVITATSSLGSGASDTTTDTTIIPYVPAAVVGLGRSGQVGPDGTGRAYPGGTITYVHSLTNTGNFTEVFDLTTHSTFGYAEVISPTPAIVGPLGPSESYTDVVVVVQIPSYAGGGETERTEVIALFFEDQQAVAENATTISFTHGLRYVASDGQDEINNCMDLDYYPCATTQRAVDQALDGDEVHVAGGVYTGVTATGGYTQALYLEESLTLRGGYTTTDWSVFDPVAHPTVLDAAGQGRVVYVVGGITPTIEGFHLRWGDVVSDGAGLYIACGATPTVRSNHIYSSTAGGMGGGVYYGGNGSPLLERNTVYSNTAEIGAGLYISGSSPGVWNNVVFRNTAVFSGGGLYVAGNGSPTVWNDTIYGNVASSGPGGGIYIHAGSPVVSNTIVVNNSATSDGGIYEGSGTPSLNYNDVWGNTPNAVPAGTGNFSANPRFFSEAGDDFHLTGASPCIDKGDANTALGDDRDGNPRPMGPALGYDVGAYEYGIQIDKRVVPTPTAASGATITYVVVITNMGTTYAPAIVTDTLHPYLEYTGTVISNANAVGAGEYATGTRTVSWMGTVTGTAAVTFTAQITDRAVAGTAITNVAWVNYTPTRMVATYVVNRPGTRYVAETGDDVANSCLAPGYPCRTVQYAVGQAWDSAEDDEVDEVWIAEGTYTSAAGAVVVITKPVTLRGGFAAGGSWAYNSQAYRTYLDGQDSRIGVIITGPVTMTATLADLRIIRGVGDGVHVTDAEFILARTWVYNNTDGVEVDGSTYQLDNNVIAHNTGSGLRTVGATAGTLRHNTFASNSGVGAVINGAAYFTNTIFYGHDTAINVASGSADLWRTLRWQGTNSLGAATPHDTIIEDDPLFVNPAGMDYHVGPDSAAIDTGIGVGVYEDVDGDARPMGGGYDIGADELRISLSVVKWADPQLVQAGGQLTYTIRVTNTGRLTLTATLTDTLPDHVAPSQVVRTSAPIPPDEIWEEVIFATVDWGYAGPLVNLVEVDSVQGATGIYTETSYAGTTPDIAVTKWANASHVEAGEQLTYTIRITNTGNVTLTVAITDDLPAAITTGDQYAWTGEVITAPNGVWTEDIVVTVDWGYTGTLTNTVRVATDKGMTDTHVLTTGAGISPAVEITKHADRDPVWAGEQLTYTIRITNTGNVDLNAVVTDTLPDYVIPTGVMTWTVPTLPPGGSWSPSPIIVTVSPSYAGPLVNVVTVTTEFASATDDAVDTITVLGPDLDVTKRASSDILQAGDRLTYTIHVTNTGNVTLTATITDTLPDHVAHATATQSLVWPARVITAPDGVWTGTFVVTVELGYEGLLTNTVQVTTEEGAGGSDVEIAWVGVVPDVEVTKWAEPEPVWPGGRLTYTIRVTNTGNVTLTADITDTLPISVTPTGLVTWTAVSIPPKGFWEETFAVTVNLNFEGTLLNLVEVTTVEGVEADDTETSTVLDICTPLTGVDFDWTPELPRAGQPAQFTAWVTPTLPVSYTWDMGGLATASGNPVNYTFPSSGTYTVVVTATNFCDVSFPADHLVNVIAYYDIYLPIVMRNG